MGKININIDLLTQKHRGSTPIRHYDINQLNRNNPMRTYLRSTLTKETPTDSLIIQLRQINENHIFLHHPVSAAKTPE